jgi:hypothetical protein
MPITCLSLTLLCGGLACTPKMAGPTAPSGYRFSVMAFPASILSSAAAADNDPPWTVYERTADLSRTSR